METHRFAVYDYSPVTKTKSELLKAYEQEAAVHGELVEYLTEFMEKMCAAEKVRVHDINGRVKNLKSFAAKVSKPDSAYVRLSDVHDVAGVRVITYLNHEVDKVAEIVKREFEIDHTRTADRRIATDPDRFGYTSLHFVVKLSSSRLQLTEFKRFCGLVAEIQIRSIIQHAWAEIEHDLGYKSAISVPENIKRRFSRLAALLELADEQFEDITRDVETYAGKVASEVTRSNSATGAVAQEIEIDAVSLSVFAKKNRLVSELDEEIAKASKSKLYYNKRINASAEAERFRALGVTKLSEVELILLRHRTLIVKWAAEWLNPGEDISSGLCLFYALYILLAERYNVEDIAYHLGEAKIGPEEPTQIAVEVVETYRRLRG